MSGTISGPSNYEILQQMQEAEAAAAKKPLACPPPPPPTATVQDILALQIERELEDAERCRRKEECSRRVQQRKREAAAEIAAREERAKSREYFPPEKWRGADLLNLNLMDYCLQSLPAPKTADKPMFARPVCQKRYAEEKRLLSMSEALVASTFSDAVPSGIGIAMPSRFASSSSSSSSSTSAPDKKKPKCPRPGCDGEMDEGEDGKLVCGNKKCKYWMPAKGAYDCPRRGCPGELFEALFGEGVRCTVCDYCNLDDAWRDSLPFHDDDEESDGEGGRRKRPRTKPEAKAPPMSSRFDVKTKEGVAADKARKAEHKVIQGEISKGERSVIEAKAPEMILHGEQPTTAVSGALLLSTAVSRGRVVFVDSAHDALEGQSKAAQTKADRAVERMARRAKAAAHAVESKEAKAKPRGLVERMKSCPMAVTKPYAASARACAASIATACVEPSFARSKEITESESVQNILVTWTSAIIAILADRMDPRSEITEKLISTDWWVAQKNDRLAMEWLPVVLQACRANRMFFCGGRAKCLAEIEKFYGLNSS